MPFKRKIRRLFRGKPSKDKESGRIVVTDKESGHVVVTDQKDGRIAVTDQQDDRIAVTDQEDGRIAVTDQEDGRIAVTDQEDGRIAVTDQEVGQPLKHEEAIATKTDNKTSVHSFPDYLKQIARRSKAGFDKVHAQIKRRYYEKSVSMEKNVEKKASLRRKRINGSKAWSSTGALRQNSESFKSYMEQKPSDRSNTSSDTIKEINEGEEGNTDKTVPNEDKLQSKVSVENDCRIKEEISNTNTISSEIETQFGQNCAIRQYKKADGDADFRLKQSSAESKSISKAGEVNVKGNEIIYDAGFYMIMDGEHKQAATDDSDGEDYIDMSEILLDVKEDEEYSECGDYTNCEMDSEYSVPTNNRKVDDDIYSSPDLFEHSVLYDVPRKSSETGSDELNRKTNTDEEQLDHDYVNCDDYDKKVFPPKSKQKPVPTTRKTSIPIPSTTNQKFRTLPGKQSSLPENLSLLLKGSQDNSDAAVSLEQTKFYTYTVDEVVNVFNSCALPHLAKICKQELLDGEYFRDVRKEDLCNEPFGMTQFHVCKLYRIMNGWRPKQSSVN